MSISFEKTDMLETRLNDRITAIETSINERIDIFIENFQRSLSRQDEEIRDLKKILNYHMQHHQKDRR